MCGEFHFFTRNSPYKASLNISHGILVRNYAAHAMRLPNHLNELVPLTPGFRAHFFR